MYEETNPVSASKRRVLRFFHQLKGSAVEQRDSSRFPVEYLHLTQVVFLTCRRNAMRTCFCGGCLRLNPLLFFYIEKFLLCLPGRGWHFYIRICPTDNSSTFYHVKSSFHVNLRWFGHRLILFSRQGWTKMLVRQRRTAYCQHIRSTWFSLSIIQCGQKTTTAYFTNYNFFLDIYKIIKLIFLTII